MLYRPDSDEISRTVPGSNIEICILPRNAAAENGSAPGLVSAFRCCLPPTVAGDIQLRDCRSA